MVSKPPTRGFAEAWLVESKTDMTAKYTVSKRPDGTFACSCPAWKFHPAPKVDCKHCLVVRNSLGTFTANARILTSEGYKPVADIEPGDTIQTPSGPRRVLATPPMTLVDDIPRYGRNGPERATPIAVTFDGVLVGHITEAQAEQFKTNMRLASAAKPPQPTPLTTNYGDFTIRRKFRL